MNFIQEPQYWLNIHELIKNIKNHFNYRENKSLLNIDVQGFLTSLLREDFYGKLLFKSFLQMKIYKEDF